MSITEKRDKRLLVFICAGAYFASYLTRVNYKAVLSEIIASEGFAKSEAAAALTGLFITYGIGQLISGWLGDRINPKYLMCSGLVLASAMNFILPLRQSTAWMTVIWCVNGFGQALMWPPIVKTLSAYLSDDGFIRATVRVSWGSNLATILLYLGCPVMIGAAGWKSVFGVCGAVGLAAAAALFVLYSKIEKKYGKSVSRPAQKEIQPAETAERPKYTPFIAALLGGVLLIIILQGILRDGIDTWMPSYVSEVFSLSTKISILSGVVLPIFTVLSYEAARIIFSKVLRSEMFCGAVFFIFCAVCSALLLAARNASPVISVLLFALAVGSTHGVNQVMTCFVPGRFKKFGNISTISGVTNFATYVGSALSTYAFASITENSGWNATVVSWVVIAAAGAAVCLVLFFPWRRFLVKYHSSGAGNNENSN